ncbi:putative benzoate 4-monooxygenase cytochrome P450 [Xylaria venustula]|nr:putative benzoate 4-monooxygenase cytochrome P450 [Xylaria venustula]
MPPFLLHRASLGALISGLIIHHTIFIKGEWHLHGPLILRLYVALSLISSVTYCYIAKQNFVSCVLSTAFLLSFHVIGLFGSIFLYRAWFHPLKHFHGPFLAKTSKIWHVWKIRHTQNHLFLEALRKEYGDFIRTGPNELTIFHPGGLNVMSRTENATRSSWYDLFYPYLSIATVRDQFSHDKRRRIWESAFTTNGMGYETQIREHARRMRNTVKRPTGKEVNMNLEIYHFTYNVMRDIEFGQLSKASDRDWKTSVNTLHTGASSFTILPLVRDWDKLMSSCKDKITERLAIPTPERRDLSAWLIEDAKKREVIDSPDEQRWLAGDAFAAILAGFDSTASTLIFAFLYLGEYPEYQTRIFKEIQTAGGDISELSFQDLQKLRFLNAFIDEVLRLHPALLSSGSKIICDNGRIIGNTFIPGGTEVYAPRWSFGRHEAHYERPQEFLPDRWLEDSSLVKDLRAFTPWSIGKWSCVGRQVALFILRYVITLLVRNYSFCLPAEDNGSQVEAQCQDQVTAHPGQLTLIFHPRDAV